MAPNNLVMLVIIHRIARTLTIHFHWLFIFIVNALVIYFE